MKKLYTHPKAKKRMKRPEQLLQIGIMNFAQRVMRLENCERYILYHCPNGGGRSKAEASIFKAMGVLAGVADIVVHIKPNKVCEYPATLFIEMKAKGGDLTDNQIWFEDRVSAMGFKHYVLEAENQNEALNKFIAIMSENGVKF